MKNYYTPQLNIFMLQYEDIVTASLGNAENEMKDIFDDKSDF